MPQMPPGMGDPMMPPQDPGAPISEEQYKELVDLLNKVKEKGASITSSNFVIKNEATQRKRDALKEVFMQLAADGIDLTDQASVGQFVTKLQERNPDLYELFTSAMDELMNENNYGDSGEEALQPGVPGIS